MHERGRDGLIDGCGLTGVEHILSDPMLERLREEDKEERWWRRNDEPPSKQLTLPAFHRWSRSRRSTLHHKDGGERLSCAVAPRGYDATAAPRRAPSGSSSPPSRGRTPAMRIPAARRDRRGQTGPADRAVASLQCSGGRRADQSVGRHDSAEAYSVKGAMIKSCLLCGSIYPRYCTRLFSAHGLYPAYFHSSLHDHRYAAPRAHRVR